MLNTRKEKVLYIDIKNQHLEDEHTFAIHPAKFSWLSYFQKETFDRAVIQNVPNSYIKSLSLFYVAQCVKINGIVDIYVDQPISVMQDLDASEVEANAKLAGFSDIQQAIFEKWIKQGDQDIKFSTIKISMLRPERVVQGSEGSPSKITRK